MFRHCLFRFYIRFALSKLSTKSEKALEAQARGSAYLAQLINCRLYIRISRSINLELLRYKKMLKACRNSRVEESVFARLATEIVDAGNIITGLLSVLLLIFLVSKRGLTVGIAVQSYQLVLLCYSPFPLVLNCWAQLQPSFRSLHRVLELRRLLEAEKPNLYVSITLIELVGKESFSRFRRTKLMRG